MQQEGVSGQRRETCEGVVVVDGCGSWPVGRSARPSLLSVAERCPEERCSVALF